MVPIPLTDHIRRRTFWAFTLLLIVINFWAFFLELTLGPHLNRFILQYGLIPARYSSAHLFALPASRTVAPIFVSMFLHGGWLHLLGNMLFLFVFGRSIEDRFGHFRFLLLYLASGVVAAVVQIFISPGSRIPTIGASGAIAGVLGAYFICYPGARITTLIPLFIFFWTVQVPAILLLGYWFLIQFVAGFEMLSIQTATAGGVAWWAHIGGFASGVLLALIMRPQHRGPMVEVVS
ncbi:MAG: rhomboid family intramembrane serine protease [Acidobacteriota bacterium]|nr:rhomboid family intramembrane serine protease [Acidobacteriota bacterium]